MARESSQISLIKDISIRLKNSFSRSANLKLDYQDKGSLQHLILSEKFQRHFVNVSSPLLDDNSNQRVHVLSGTPGVGKSTFAVLLTKVISKGLSRQVSITVEKQSKNLSSEFKKSYEGAKKLNYLPVFLNGDEGEIEDAFYEALKSAFTDFGLIKEFIELSEKNSHRAFEIISNWRKSYPKKYEELKKIHQKRNGCRI